MTQSKAKNDETKEPEKEMRSARSGVEAGKPEEDKPEEYKPEEVGDPATEIFTPKAEDPADTEEAEDDD